MNSLINSRSAATRRAGFTLIEMLAVVGVLTLLLALIIPAIANVRENARETTCASNLRQLGVATQAYLTAWRDHLPQKTCEVAPGIEVIVGALFGGKKGELSMFCVDEFGIEERPLNAYLAATSQQPEYAEGEPSSVLDHEEMPLFESPVDRGQPETSELGLEYVPSMYDYIGTSYTLNDHTLEGEDCATLIPAWTGPPSPHPDGRPGGRMPRVHDPALTWMIGSIPIYNYQEGNDRGQRWAFREPRVNLTFVDGHVGQGIRTPPMVQHTTRQYTFLPHRGWKCPDGSLPQPKWDEASAIFDLLKNWK